MKKHITLLSLILVTSLSATQKPWQDKEVTLSPKELAHHLREMGPDLQKIQIALIMRGEMMQPGDFNPNNHITEKEAADAYNEGYKNGAACLDESQKEELDKVVKGKKIILAALVKRYGDCIGNNSSKTCEKDVVKYAGALHKEMGLPNPKDLVKKRATTSAVITPEDQPTEEEVDAIVAYLLSHVLPMKK